MSLTFDQVRAANIERLPQFKNSNGGFAHSTPDGHDWTPAQWFQAFIGEVGEYAEARILYEAGGLPQAVYEKAVAKEIADFFLYGDIMARRALDTVTHWTNDPASLLMRAMAEIGAYANARKKYERGDITGEILDKTRGQTLTAAISYLMEIRSSPSELPAPVRDAHPTGVDVGAAIAQKFNEVSRRIGVDVFLPE